MEVLDKNIQKKSQNQFCELKLVPSKINTPLKKKINLMVALVGQAVVVVGPVMVLQAVVVGGQLAAQADGPVVVLVHQAVVCMVTQVAGQVELGGLIIQLMLAVINLIAIIGQAVQVIIMLIIYELILKTAWLNLAGSKPKDETLDWAGSGIGGSAPWLNAHGGAPTHGNNFWPYPSTRYPRKFKLKVILIWKFNNSLIIIL